MSTPIFWAGACGRRRIFHMCLQGAGAQPCRGQAYGALTLRAQTRRAGTACRVCDSAKRPRRKTLARAAAATRGARTAVDDRHNYLRRLILAANWSIINLLQALHHCRKNIINNTR